MGAGGDGICSGKRYGHALLRTVRNVTVGKLLSHFAVKFTR